MTCCRWVTLDVKGQDEVLGEGLDEERFDSGTDERTREVVALTEMASQRAKLRQLPCRLDALADHFEFEGMGQ